MADDTIQVGVDVVAPDSEIRKLVGELDSAFKGVMRLTRGFQDNIDKVKTLEKTIGDLGVKLSNTKGAARSQISKEILSLQKELIGVSAQIAKVGEEVKANSLKNSAARNAVMQQKTGDGRTLAEASLKNYQTDAVIKAINTEAAQVQARIADAAAKAAERMLRTAGNAITARIEQTRVGELIRQRTYNDRDTVEALLNQAGIRNEKLRRTFGGVKTLDDFESARDDARILDGLKRHRLRYERDPLYAQRADDSAMRNYGRSRGDVDNLLASARNVSEQRRILEELRAVHKDQLEHERKTLNDKKRADADAETARKKAQAELDRVPTALARRNLQYAQNPEFAKLEDERTMARYGKTRPELNDLIAGKDRSEQRAILDELRKATLDRVKAEKDAAEATRRKTRDAERIPTMFARRSERYEKDAEFSKLEDERTMLRYGRSRGELNQMLSGKSFEEQRKILDDLRQAEIKLSEARKQAAKDAREAAKPVKPTTAQLTPEQRALEGARSASLYRNAVVDLDGGRDFLGFQARLIANYALIGTAIAAVTGTVGAVTQLDDTLKQFQAITQTSNSEIVSFKSNLLALAQTSRFTIDELAQAAITIGQTGASAADVEKTLKPVVTLALASGSSLKDAVEVVTATLGAYNMESSRAADIANTLTAALNQTKLTMTQLQLGIQYAANIAREAGISFSELTALVGGIAQAGVRSGSTIGTGLRTLITDLVNPTEKLKSVMSGLGISLADIDIKAYGLVGVLENLRQKGFGAAQAIQAFELRGAAAFSALSGQADRVKRLQESILLTDAAATGAAKSQESFIASLSRLRNTALSLADTAFTPLLSVIKALTDGLAGLLQRFSGSETALKAIGFTFAGFVTAISAIRLGALIGIPSLLTSIGVASAGAAGGVTALSGAMGLLARNPLIAGTIVAATGLGIVFGLVNMQTEAQKAAEKLDKLNGVMNELISRELRFETAITDIDRQIDTLNIRREKLNSDPIGLRTAIIEAQKAYGDLGLAIKSTATSADELIEAYRRLRTELRQDISGNLVEQMIILQKQMDALKEKAKSDVGPALSRLLVASGFRAPVFDLTSPEDKLKALRTRPELKGFQRSLEIVADPFSALPSNDPRGSAQGERLSILREVDRLSAEARGLKAQPSLSPTDQARLDKITKTIDLFDELNRALEQSIKTVEDNRAKTIKLEQTRIDVQTKEVQTNPEFRSIEKRASDLDRDLTEKSRKILSDQTLSTTQKTELINEAIRQALPKAQELNNEIVRLAESLQAQGVPFEALSLAFKDLNSVLTGLARGNATKDLINILEPFKKLATLDLTTERRQLDSKITLLLKRAAASRDPKELSMIEDEIKRAANRQIEISRRMVELKANDPFNLNAEEREARDAAEEDGKNKLLSYMERIIELRKQMTDAALAIESTALDNQKKEIDKQIANLKKMLEDPSTTIEKAKQIREEINKLLDQVVKILREQADVQLRKELLNDRGGFVTTPAGNANEVVKLISDTINNAGRADLLALAIKMAKAESDFNPQARNSKSGAAGVFQFMPDTAKGFGLDDPYDVVKATQAWIRLYKANEAYFRKNVADRAPTDFEAFLLHNQGLKGGSDLLNAPMGKLAAGIVGGQAVVQNRGAITDTAQEFVEKLRKFWEERTEGTDKYFKSTSEALKDNAKVIKETAREGADVERQKVDATIKEREQKITRAIQAREEAAIDTDLRKNRSAVRIAANASEASDAAGRAVDDYIAKFGKAMDRLKETNEYKQASEPERQSMIDALRARISDDATRAIGQMAKEIGDVTIKNLKDELQRAKDKLEELERPENAGKFSPLEAEKQKRVVAELQRQVDLEGELARRRAETKAIDEGIRRLKEAGVVDDEKTLELTERKKALEEEILKLLEQQGLKKKADAAAPTLTNYLNKGYRDALKSRGVLDDKGNLVSDFAQMGKMLEESVGVAASAMDRLFEGLITGTLKGKQAFADFARSILADMAKIISKSLTNQLLGGIFSMFGGASGGNPLSSLFGGGGSAAAGTGIEASFSSFFTGFKMGGVIRAAMGYSRGIPNRDSVPILAEPGEAILRKTAVDAIGRDGIESLNNLSSVKNSDDIRQPMMKGESKSDPSVVNVWVVSPDQVPPPSENDIIMTVAGNAERGGVMKTLIKSIAVGAI